LQKNGHFNDQVCTIYKYQLLGPSAINLCLKMIYARHARLNTKRMETCFLDTLLCKYFWKEIRQVNWRVKCATLLFYGKSERFIWHWVHFKLYKREILFIFNFFYKFLRFKCFHFFNIKIFSSFYLIFKYLFFNFDLFVNNTNCIFPNFLIFLNFWFFRSFSNFFLAYLIPAYPYLSQDWWRPIRKYLKKSKT